MPFYEIQNVIYIRMLTNANSCVFSLHAISHRLISHCSRLEPLKSPVLCPAAPLAVGKKKNYRLNPSDETNAASSFLPIHPRAYTHVHIQLCELLESFPRLICPRRNIKAGGGVGARLGERERVYVYVLYLCVLLIFLHLSRFEGKLAAH